MMDETFLKRVNDFVYHYPASWESAFRTPHHNRVVKGAEHSLHLQGKAIDLIYDTVSELWLAGQAAVASFNGVEIDLTNYHLHLDDRTILWQVVKYKNTEGKIVTKSFLDYLTLLKV